MSDRKELVLSVMVGASTIVAHFVATLASFFQTVFGAIAPLAPGTPNLGVMFTALTFPGSIVWNVFDDHLYGNDALFFGTMAGNSIFWGVVVGALLHRLRRMKRTHALSRGGTGVM